MRRLNYAVIASFLSHLPRRSLFNWIIIWYLHYYFPGLVWHFKHLVIGDSLWLDLLVDEAIQGGIIAVVNGLCIFNLGQTCWWYLRIVRKDRLLCFSIICFFIQFWHLIDILFDGADIVYNLLIWKQF